MHMLYSASTQGFYSVEVHGTDVPTDAVAVDEQRYLACSGHLIFTAADGLPSPVVDPATSPESQLTLAVQAILDRAACNLGFDSILAAISYRGDPNPVFAAQAEAFFVWRSDCWTAAYAYLADVQAGTKPFPSLEDLPGLLPSLEI